MATFLWSLGAFQTVLFISKWLGRLLLLTLTDLPHPRLADLLNCVHYTWTMWWNTPAWIVFVVLFTVHLDYRTKWTSSECRGGSDYRTPYRGQFWAPQSVGLLFLPITWTKDRLTCSCIVEPVHQLTHQSINLTWLNGQSPAVFPQLHWCLS